MKNVLQQKPDDKLSARLLASVAFVDDQDIAGKAVLDIGCGFGWCEMNFLSRGVKQVTGIEISDMDLLAARKGIKDSRAKFVTAGALKLPFDDASFDTVVSWEVIEHIPKGSEQQMFAEVKRVLKPGGSFYISTPHDQLFAKLLDPAWWLIGHRHYSAAALATYARQHDFEVLDTQIKGSVWTVLGILNMYVSKWGFRREPFFARFFERHERHEYAQSGFANIFQKMKKVTGHAEAT